MFHALSSAVVSLFHTLLGKVVQVVKSAFIVMKSAGAARACHDWPTQRLTREHPYRHEGASSSKRYGRLRWHAAGKSMSEVESAYVDSSNHRTLPTYLSKRGRWEGMFCSPLRLTVRFVSAARPR